MRKFNEQEIAISFCAGSNQDEMRRSFHINMLYRPQVGNISISHFEIKHMADETKIFEFEFRYWLVSSVQI